MRARAAAPLLIIGLAVVLGTPGAGRAQAPVWSFDLRGQELSSALIALAVQTDVSIGRAPGTTCAGRSPPLVGRYTLRQAMERLLAGTACTFRMIDSRTVLLAPRLKASAPKPLPTSAVPASPTQEVIVTASRRRETIDRSPYDVTQVGTDELTNTRVTDANGLASLVAGMTVTNLGPGRDKIILRGLSDGIFTGRTQSTVSLYLDDVPLTYNAPDPDLRLLDVDAVEVLRGPQGVLYGAGSIGGVVHIITRKPDLAAYAGSLDLTASTTQSGEPSTVVEGVANLPLIRDHLAVRIAAYREVDGGYIDDPRMDRRDIDDTTRQGARVQALIQLSPAWKATIGGIYQSINSSDTQYGVGGLPAYTRDNRLSEPHDNDFDEVSLVVDGEGRGWRFKSSTSVVRHDIASQYDASDSLSQFAPGLTGAAPFIENDRKSLLSQEFNLASAPSAKAQWIVGLFALDDQEHSASRLTDLSGAVSPALVLYGENRSDTIDEFAAYGELTYPLCTRLFLTLGGRLFQSRESTGSIVTTPAVRRGVNGQTHDQGVAPKAVLRYQITPGAMVYLQGSEGYRGGGLNTSALPSQVFGSGAGGVQPFQRYAGDQLWNFELGAKAALFRSKLSLRAAIFYDTWDNIQTDQIQASGLPYVANVGDGINKGLELEAIYQPTSNLFVRANGVLNDPELVNKAAGFAALPDASLPGVSSVSYGGEIGYRRNLTERLAVFTNARASYVGSSSISFDASSRATMGRYTSGTITGGIDLKTWRLEAFIDNPANTVGDTFAFGNPFSVHFEKQTTPLRPRTIGLRVHAEF